MLIFFLNNQYISHVVPISNARKGIVLRVQIQYRIELLIITTDSKLSDEIFSFKINNQDEY